MTRKDLEEKLRGLPFRDTRIEFEEYPGRFVVILSSPDFDQKDEAERQEQVWSYLLENLTPEEQLAVEFVFTFTPEERRELSSAG